MAGQIKFIGGDQFYGPNALFVFQRFHPIDKEQGEGVGEAVKQILKPSLFDPGIIFFVLNLRPPYRTPSHPVRLL